MNVMNSTHKELAAEDLAVNDLAVNDLAVQVDGLSFEFRFGIPILRDFSFDIPKGSMYGVLGRNGSGKSTLLQCLIGLLEPKSGQCRVLGLDPLASTFEVRQRVGYVPQVPQFEAGRSGKEQFDFMRPLYDGRWNLQLEGELIEDFGLTNYLSREVRKLSLGQQRQLSLVAALAFEPDLLILDEPSVSIDAVVRHRFTQRVVDYMAVPGRTVVVASHMISEVERLADQVMVVDEQRILVSAELDELKKSLLCMTARFPTEPPVLGEPFDVLVQRRHGNSLELAVWNHHGAAAGLEDTLKELGASSTREVEPSLESLFVHLAGGRD